MADRTTMRTRLTTAFAVGLGVPHRGSLILLTIVHVLRKGAPCGGPSFVCVGERGAGAVLIVAEVFARARKRGGTRRIDLRDTRT
jgi:hypothetical protein